MKPTVKRPPAPSVRTTTARRLQALRCGSPESYPGERLILQALEALEALEG